MRGVLAARESAAAWDLRGAWASRRVVVLALDPDRAVLPRIEGYVEHVAASNAFAEILELDGGEISVPCAVILSVRRPHFQEPADAGALLAPDLGRRETVLDRYPGQLSLLPEDAPGVPSGEP